MSKQIIPIAILLVFALVIKSIGGIESMYYLLLLILIGVVFIKIDTIRGWIG
jgi:hypothetical protein